MTYKTILNLLPDPAEIRSRAIVLAKIDEKLGLGETTFTKNFNRKGSDRYFWEDGAGNEANIIFKADGKNDNAILMFAYDHECAFNYFGEEDAHQIIFDGLPETFAHLLTGSELKWDWDDSANKQVWATTAVWHTPENNKWEMNPAFAEEAIKANDEGGFNYAFELFMRPFSSHRVIKEYEDLGYEVESLDVIKKIFKKYYPHEEQI